MGRTGSGGAGACARVCRTDPHAGKRSAGASGSRRCSYLHCGGVWKHVELTVAPQAQGTKPSEKPGVRLHGRARRARLTERPRPRRPPLPASPQAWRWTPPIDGGGQTDGTGVSEEDAEPSSSAPGGLVLTPPPPAAACRSHMADVVLANTPRQRTSEGCSPQPPASSPDPGRGSLHEGCEPVTAEPEETLLVFLRLKWLRCPDRGNSFCGQKWDSPFKGGQRPFPLDRAPNPEPGHRLPDWPRGTSPVQGQGFLSRAG